MDEVAKRGLEDDEGFVALGGGVELRAEVVEDPVCVSDGFGE